MEWLAQNWFWLVFGIGMLFMMRRGAHGGGIGGCCGGGHGSGHGGPDTRATANGSQGEPATGGADGHRK
jgi:hypothetical protein